jgi:hypothetical protein
MQKHQPPAFVPYEQIDALLQALIIHTAYNPPRPAT